MTGTGKIRSTVNYIWSRVFSIENKVFIRTFVCDLSGHTSKPVVWLFPVKSLQVLVWFIRCQAITRTNDDWLSIGPEGWNFSELCIKIQWFFIKEKCRPFCLGLNVLSSVAHLSVRINYGMYHTPSVTIWHVFSCELLGWLIPINISSVVFQ